MPESNILQSIAKQIQKLFRISPKEREKVYKDINQKANVDFPFTLNIILSTIIVSLGLIVNNAAVVIGGMLIAPVIWPILSFSIGVTRGRVRTVRKSFLNILKISFIILLVSVLVGFVSPFNTYQEEVLTRTQPTLIELLIALTAGFIASYSSSSKQLMGSIIGGVAVSVALLPPLSVAGITMASGATSQSLGSILLYMTNLLAIAVASIIVFMLEGYFTSTSDSAEDSRKSYLMWSFGLLILISIPLVFLTRSLIKEQKANNFVLQTTKNAYPQSRVTDITLNNKDLSMVIDITVQREGEIDRQGIQKLSKVFSAHFKKPVTLNINHVQLKRIHTTEYYIE